MRNGTVRVLFVISTLLLPAAAVNCPPCPQGTSCDGNTGICRQFRPPAGGGDFDRCTGVSCPWGQQCDTNTGRCVVFRDPNNDGTYNRCNFIQCPSGYQCDWSYGVCRSFRDPNVDPSVKNCANVLCPQGTMCDENTGICRQFRPPAVFRRYPPTKCDRVNCPNGYVCDVADGVCKLNATAPSAPEVVTTELFQADPQPAHPPAPSIAWRRPTVEVCPPNSEYVECGSRCPYTCSLEQPRCFTNEHNCVGACQCLDGFVQVSSANVTCVEAKKCPAIAESLCKDLRCSAEMICVDGYCQPVSCPPILKPQLERGCEYELVRDTRNCVTLESSCH